MNTVKKIFLLFLLCVTCATSCKKDEDELAGSIVVSGTMETVSTTANSNTSISNLDSELKRVFGEDYRLSQASLRVTIKGSINESDFEPLKYFAEVNLEETAISGEMKINQEVLSTGAYRETYEENAIPMSAFYGSEKLQKITFADGSNEDFPAIEFIGVSAFGECPKLEVVSNIKSVEFIGSQAFKDSSRYGVDVKFKPGAALKTIGLNAFEGCSSLCGVDLSEATGGLTIGEYSFTGCTSMTSLILPDYLVSMGMYSFNDCESLLSITSNLGSDIVTKGDDTDDIVVPTLNAMTLPDTFKVSESSPKVIYIESEAISAYSAAGGWSEYNIQSPDSEGWKIVYNEANEDDSSANTLDAKLKGVFGVTYAQKDSYKVKVVGTMNEADFKSLRSGFSHVDLSEVDVVGYITVGSSYSTSVVTRATTPSTVEGNAIPADIFASANYKIQSFTVPTSVTVIGEAAFENNTTLNDLNLTTDAGLKLSTAAFRGTGLGGTDSFFSDGDGAIEVAANVVEIGDYVFDDCDDLKSISFKGTTSNIKITESSFPEAFYDPTQTEFVITVPASASGIYNTATIYNEETDSYETSYWKSCNRVQDDGGKISEYSVTGFGNSSDMSVGNLQKSLIEVFGDSYNTQTKIILSGTINQADFEYLRTFEDIDMTNVTMVGDIHTTVASSEGVKSTYAQALPYNAFCGGIAGSPTTNGNTILKRIVLPKGLQELGVYSLANCASLSTIIFSGTEVQKFNTGVFKSTLIPKFPGDVVAEDDYASATGLVNFPRTLSAHAGSLFQSCLYLTEANFSEFEGLTILESSFFSGCTNLSSVTLPTGADFTNIQTLAFYNCASLPLITINSNVLYVGIRAFEGCTSLTSIDIPSSITGNTSALKDLSGVFNGCTSLVKVNVNWVETKADAEADIAAVAFAAPTIYKETAAVDGVTKYMSFPESFLKGGSRYITVAEGTLSKYIDEDGASTAEAPGWANYNLAEAGENKLTLNTEKSVAEQLETYFTENIGVTELILAGTIAGGVDDMGGIPVDFVALNVALSAHPELTTLDMSDLVITGDYSTVLPNSAFVRNATLKIVTLPTTVETIDVSAFENSKVEIVFADAVTAVSENAFTRAASLTAISLPNVEKIGMNAFQNTTALSNFVLPSSTTYVGVNAFADSGLTSVNIPSSITSIGDDVFNGCSKLSSVVLPSTLESIGESAFEGCALSSVTIPVSVTDIKNYAFAGNRSLATITFETAETVVDLKLGAYAFAACDKMSSVTLPTRLAKIGDNVFGEEGNETYPVCDILTNISILYDATALPTVSSATDFTFPETRFKAGSSIGTITLPSGADADDYSAWVYYNLSEASEFTVTTTEGGLKEAILTKWRDFYSNPRSTIVVVGSMNATDFDALQMEVDGVSYAFADIDLSGATISGSQIPESTFVRNTSLTRLILPQTISAIGNYAFNSCSNLLEFEFPAALTSIGTYSFVGTKIGSVSGMPNLTTIGIYAFRNCTLLKSVDLTEATDLVLTESNTNMFYGCSLLSSVKLPDTLTLMPEGMFYQCTSLKNITLPESVEWIDSKVFYGCTALESISLPESVNHFEPNGTGIYQTFYGCTALTEISVNWTSVDQIPTIDSTVFPDPFWASRAQNSISIPSSGITVEEYQSVSGWSEYSLAVGGKTEVAVTEAMGLGSALIVKWGANWAANEDYVESGYSLKVTGKASLSDFNTWYTTLSSTVKTLDISELSLVDSDSKKVVELPASWWTSASLTATSKLTKVILSDEITSIGKSAFYSATKLTSVTMDGVTSIGETAFAYCTALKEVELQDAITEIGTGAYKYATGLTTFSTPTRAITAAESDHIAIGESVFEGCAALTNVSLGHGVKSIGADAFKGCSTLGLISLPSTITSLGKAFDGCSQLINIEIAWSTSDLAAKITSDTFPDKFSSTNKEGNILLPVDSKTTGFKDSTWAAYNLVPQELYTVVNTAGNLATNMALKGANITDTVMVIGNMNSDDFAAFADYTLSEIDLSGVVVTGTVTYSGTTSKYGNAIPTSAFSGLTSLTTVTLSATVTHLGDSAFFGCTALETLNDTTSGLEFIGESAFDGCSSLTFDFESDFPLVTEIPSRAFASVIFEDDGVVSTLGLTDKITAIGDSAFADCTFGDIIMPLTTAEAVKTTLGKVEDVQVQVAVSVFPTSYSIYGTTEITITNADGAALNGDTANGGTAADNDSLAALCGDSTTPGAWFNFRVKSYAGNSYQREDGALIVENSADDEDWTYNTLTATIRKIAGYEEFDPTDTATIYDNIYVLGTMNNADFESLKVFKNVDLSGVSVVGEILIAPALYSNDAYTEPVFQTGAAIPTMAFASVKEDYTNFLQTDASKCITSYTSTTFYDYNTVLESITFPVSITTVGAAAFVYCSGLTEINFIEGTPVQYLKSSVFAYTNMTEIKIPATVISIEWACFGYNSSLVKADYSAITATTMTTFAGAQFINCTALENFQFPEQLETQVAGQMFQECKSLPSFHADSSKKDEGAYFPATKGIAANAFKNCIALTRVEFPESVNGLSATNSEFSNTSFNGCSALTEIICPWTSSVPTLTYNDGGISTIPDQFLKSTGSNFISVPESAVDLYTDNWALYNLRASGLDLIELDGSDTLETLLEGDKYSIWTNGKAASSYGLTKLYISGEMTSSDYAALESIKATSLDLSGVTSDTVYASANTTITDITLSDATTTIESDAFAGWSNGVTLSAMPASLKTIEANAFANVIFVDNVVTLPDTITSIGDEAFKVTDLAYVYLPWTDVDGAYLASAVPSIGSDVFPLSLQAEGLLAPYGTDVATMYAAWTGYTVSTVAGEIASYTYNVSEAGTVSELLKDIDPCAEGVSVELKLMGNLDATDIAYLATAASTYAGTAGFPYIDLSGAKIDGNAIADEAFKGNAVLKTLMLPNSVVTIGASAFEGASKFATLEWSAGAVATVGDAAFKGTALGMTSIQAVLNNVTAIPASCFEGITKYVATLNLPQAVTSIGAAAFKGCTAIAEMVLPNTPATVATDSFESMTAKFSVYNKSAYDTAWALSMIDATNSVTTLFESTSTAPTVDPLTVILEIELAYTDAEIAAWGTDLLLASIPTSGKAEAAIIAAAKAAGVDSDVADNYLTNETIFKKLIVTGTPNAWDYKCIGNKFKSVDMSGVTKTVGIYQTAADEAKLGSQVPWEAFTCTYTVTNDVVTKITGSAATPETVMEELILSSTLTGYPNSPYPYMQALKTVTIPAKLGKTPWNFMAYCTALESIYFEEGSVCTTIGSGCFRGCTSLKSIVLPESLATFSVSMFNACSSLESINIPSGVTTLMTSASTDEKNGAFYGCTSLKTITAAWTADQAASTDMVAGYFPSQFDGDGTDGECVIIVPDAVSMYSATALAQYNLVSDGSGSGGGSAADVDEITGLVAGGLETALGDIATKATKVVITGEMNEGDFTALAAAGYADIDLADVDITGNVVDIDTYKSNTAALNGYANTIPFEVFMDNKQLESIVLPESLTYISQFAFGSNTVGATLKTVVWNPTASRDECYVSIKAFASTLVDNDSVAVILDKVTEVANNAFLQCSNVTEVYLPSHITSLGKGAFSIAAGIELHLPELKSTDSVVSIYSTATEKEQSFYAKTSTVSYPNTNPSKEMYEAAFADSTTPNAWYKYISEYGLETPTAEIPEINASTYELTISGLTVNADGSSSAGSTGNMETLIKEEGASVTAAWENGDIFGKITVSGVLSAGDLELLRTRFYSVDMSGVTFNGYHKSSATAYSDYSTSTTAFPFAALENSTTIRELVFPSTLTSFKNKGCTGLINLKSIIIPANVGTLGYFLFSGCTSLETVTFPDTQKVSKLGGGVFKGCTKLTTITLPETMKEFSNNEFNGCSSLTSINIPAAITIFSSDIEDSAKYISTNFSGCTALKSITTGWVSKATYDAASAGDQATMYTVPAAIKDAYSSLFPDAFLADNTGGCVIYAPEAKSAYASTDTANGESTFVLYNVAEVAPDGVYSIADFASMTSVSDLPNGTDWKIWDSSVTTAQLQALGTAIDLANGAGITPNLIFTNLETMPSMGGSKDSAYCTGSFTVELTVATTISGSAFAFSGVTSVSAPVATTLNDTSLRWCASLATISVPKATSVGNNVFAQLPALTSLKVGNESADGFDFTGSFFFNSGSNNDVKTTDPGNVDLWIKLSSSSTTLIIDVATKTLEDTKFTYTLKSITTVVE